MELQNLPIDIIEKIRRYTYKPQSNELLEDIKDYYYTKSQLDKLCKQTRLNIYGLLGLIKCLDIDNTLTPCKFSMVVEQLLRHYKYKKYKYFILIDIVMKSKINWSILGYND